MLTLFTLWFFYVRLWFYVSIILFIFVLAQSADLSSTINEKGCLLAGEEWLEKNLIVVAGVAVGIAFLQVRTLFSPYFCAFGFFPLLPFISRSNCDCKIINNAFTFSDSWDMFRTKSSSRHICTNGQMVTTLSNKNEMKTYFLHHVNILGTDIAGLQLLFDLNLRRRPQRSINARSTKGIWFRKLISPYHLTHHAAVVGAEIFSYNCLNVYSFCTERQPSDLCIHMKNKLTIFLLANDRITSIRIHSAT